MIKYSKSLGHLFDFKQHYFESDGAKTAELMKWAKLYAQQPKRTQCKNCRVAFNRSAGNVFHKWGVEYILCHQCGHCNGMNEDTVEFCKALYTQEQGRDYAAEYVSRDYDAYHQRVREIYLPKAEFLRDALEEIGSFPASLCDYGAGAGYFISAARELKFENVLGYEPSNTMVTYGNEMLGGQYLRCIEMHALSELIANQNAEICSLVYVLEHLSNPHDVLSAFRKNKRIKYLFLAVPLFSPSVIFEVVFPNTCHRHLVAGHTQLYTEQSIQHLCDEYHLERMSEWWFGQDMADLYRMIQSILKDADELSELWTKTFLPLVDPLQSILDRARQVSDVHMLLAKRN